MNLKFKNKYLKILLLFACLAVGCLLRIHQLSPYKFYPDAYQSLLVAENIRFNGSVFGTLGENGYIFPPFVMWTRPAYPSLINLMVSLGLSDVNGAGLISLIAGIAAIPVGFYISKTVFKSAKIALCGMLLVSLSFNHVVWSGFIMTETLGVFFQLLFLAQLFARLKDRLPLANFHDILTGSIFALMVMTRYEYLILILPVLILHRFSSKKPYARIATFLVSFIFWMALWVSLLFSIPDLVKGLLLEVKDLLIITGAIALSTFCLFFAYQKINKRLTHEHTYTVAKLFVALLWAGYAYLLAQQMFPETFSHFLGLFSGLRVIVVNDFLLVLAALIGLSYFFLCNTQRIVSLFIVGVVALLGYVYLKINPDMFRYLTHLTPYLLLPGGYGLYYVTAYGMKLARVPTFSIRLQGFGLLVLILAAVTTQSIISFRGLHYWRNGEWHKPSYEETSASALKSLLSKNNRMLVTSQPEPYYFFTQIPTISVGNKLPFIYGLETMKDKTLTIVDDFGMKHIFPEFANFIHQKLTSYQIGEYSVGQAFHYENLSFPASQSVRVYEINGKEFNQLLQN